MEDCNKPKTTEEELRAERAALEGVVWRKIDSWVLPLCASFFLLSNLDRTNIGNARVAGMQRSLDISNYQYSMALTLTFISYILAELPSTLFLKYVGPNMMLPAMVTLWGVASAAQGFVSTFSGLLACRFFLGLMEGGLFPCIVLYLSSFYPRQRLQIRIATFYMSASLSGAFSGLLAALIDRLDGRAGKPGWAWIFILEGLVTIIFGLISAFLLPRSHETAHFLTEKERTYVTSVLKHAGTIPEEEDMDNFSWTEVARATQSVHVWLLCVVSFLSGTILFGLAFFEPIIVSSLGYKGNHAQLMSVPPFAVTFTLSLISSVVSDHYHRRGDFVIFFSLLKVIGFTMFYASSSSRVRYGSLFFAVSGGYGVVPPTATWLANNSTPHTRRATAVVMYSILTQLGGILSTWLLGWLSPAPDYTVAIITFIVMSTCALVISAANLAYLRRENRMKAERRQRTNKEEESGRLGDRSAWFIYSL